GADLAFAGLGAFPVGEVAGGVADAELAVGRGVAGAEAGAAEALPEDAARRNNIGHGAILDQFQVGGHAGGVDAVLEGAGAAVLAPQDSGHRTEVVVGTAGAAGHHARLHIDAAVGGDLADQVHLGLAAELLVGLFLGRRQDLPGVGLQVPDG